MQRILIIRLGALGDLVFCFQAFQDIRRAHPDAEIALLTQRPFVAFASKMPWFDRVLTDERPASGNFAGWLRLAKTVRDFAPDIVYDLQGKHRQSILYGLLGGPFGPQWSGAAPFCKFPRPWPPLPNMTFVDFLAAQLRAAQVPESPPVDLSWLDAPLGSVALTHDYVVLIPGSSPGTPHKRWPVQKYTELADRLRDQGLMCVAVGSDADRGIIATIKHAAPHLVDLCGQTNLFELAGLMRRAVGVIGNDTGPLQIAAAVGAPTVGLYFARSNAIWSRPPGARVAVLQSESASDLGAAQVAAAFQAFLQGAEGKG